MNNHIAGVVVLYNPADRVIDNIDSYIDKIDILYIVDNSDCRNNSVASKLQLYPKIVYIDNGENKGIAHALNIGAVKAIEANYSWLLTMDQDSAFPQASFTSYLDCCFSYPAFLEVALFSPMHHPAQIKTTGCHASYPFIVMTSGNLLNLALYNHMKGFEEKLFIDEVDHDYCLKARLNGYLVVQFSNIVLDHELGEPKLIRHKGKTIQYRAHSPLRHYYMTRNNLYFFKKYRRYYPDFIKERQTYIFKTLVFALIYNDRKIERMKYIIRGIYHFMIGHYGK